MGVRKTALILFGCAVVGTLSGCGSNEASSTERNTGQASVTLQTSSSTQTATSQTAAPFNASKTWTWDTKNTDGYTSRYVFAVDVPVSLGDAPLLTGFSQRSDVAGACSDFNSQTDALLPVQLTLTNTTGGFSKEVAANFSLTEYTPEEIREEVPYGPKDVEVVSGYGQGIECKGMEHRDGTNEQSSWGVSCQLQPNASCTTYGYLILKNYYSPSTPNGDPNALASITLQVDTGPTEHITDESGPGEANWRPSQAAELGLTGIPLSG